MLLPPTAYRANDEEIIAHYKEVSKVGLPIIAYNNPFDTKVDLTPQLVGRIAEAAKNVVAIKEFSGDVRRVWQLHHYAPRIEVLVGADDVLLELLTFVWQANMMKQSQYMQLSITYLIGIAEKSLSLRLK
jgi:4-hydroxy-tetrahydrodipicolinate synthase